MYSAMASAVRASAPLIATLAKSAVDQIVKGVTTVVQTEIRALPKQVVAAVVAQQAAAQQDKAPIRQEGSADEESSALPKSQQLWNEAYDGLEGSSTTSKIVTSYADALVFAIAGHDGETPGPSLTADFKDPIKRQAQMRDLVQRGREKFADDSKLAQTVGDVAGFVLQARGIIDVAIQNAPQAALPWAGVCAGLQILTNPAKVSRSNLAGIAHVVSRMDWYCSLVDHLLDERSIIAGNESAVLVTRRLETLVLDLYKSLLLYQMKSVSSYYRGSGLTYLRELAALDDWDADLSSITAAEEALRAASVQYVTQSSLARLSELMQRSDKMQSTLGNIDQDLQDFVAAQKLKVADDKDSACLRDLFLVDPMRELERLQRQKDRLIDSAFSWVLHSPEFSTFSDWRRGDTPRMLWLKGGPGTGKTMLSIGIVREMSSQSAAFAPSVSYYFCQGNADRSRNNATSILRGLLWMLLVQQPHLIQHLRSKHKYAGSSLFNDSNAFGAMSEGLEAMLLDPGLTPAYLMVDALDECDESRDDLVELIFKSLRLSDKVRWLVSGRPDLDLTRPGVDEALVELNAQALEGPVHAFITRKLSETLKGKPGYEDDAALIPISNEMCERASNTFLWAALALKELNGVESKDAVEMVRKLPLGLPALYGHLMAKIERLDGLTKSRSKSVLAAVYLAYRPLTLRELGVVAGLGSPIKPLSVVKACGSLLAMTGRVVTLVHQSARDYLCETYRRERDSGVAGLNHQDIASRSLLEMQHTLKRNMYHLPGSGYFPRFLGDAINGTDNDPLAAVAYSCTFWMHHVCNANDSAEPVPSRQVLSFLRKYFLRWVESLALLGKLSAGLESVKRLAAEPRFQSSAPLKSFLKDAEKFLVSHKTTIQAAVLQTYGSSLLFSPVQGSVRTFGWDERLGFIRNMVTTQQTGDAHTLTLDGRYGSVTALAFSRDGKFFSTGTEGSMTVWRTEDWTAACTIFLPESVGVAEKLSFSSDSRSILAVYGHIVHVCQMETRTQVRTIAHEEKRKISCANFDADDRSIVMALDDATVHLWDAATEATREIFAAKGETKSIIALSPENKTLAVSLLENLIGVWDVAAGTGHSARGLKSHDDAFRDFAFAGDGKTLASVSTDGTICLWDIGSGTCRRSFSPGWNNWPTIALSPDLSTLAMGGLENTTRLLSMADWADEGETQAQAQAQSHRGRVSRVVISPDKVVAATASHDRDIRIWEIERGHCLRAMRGHRDAVLCVAFSPDAETIASASSDKTVRLWRVKTAECLQTWKGHTSAVKTVVFAPDGNTVASFSQDKTVRVWTVETGSSVSIKGQSESQSCIAFSHDCKAIASVNEDGGVALWDVTTGDRLQVFDKHETDAPVALVFSSDDSAVMMGSSSGSIYALERSSGARRRVLHQREFFSSMTLADDGKTLVTSAGSVPVSASDQTALNRKEPKGTLFVYKPVEFPGMEVEARLGDVWIEGQGVLMLLPASYATNVLATCEDILILGHASGKVSFLYFDFPKRPATYAA